MLMVGGFHILSHYQSSKLNVWDAIYGTASDSCRPVVLDGQGNMQSPFIQNGVYFFVASKTVTKFSSYFGVRLLKIICRSSCYGLNAPRA